ncbi:DNA-dependent metalloprotease SPRTN [Hyperolius riggenbachi]|uniref:DNA-dependent metalloprotease SPRTN n=1 Tax=Hyperolius riggenbachi TaxID=752182 RepID=UPI0035A2CA5C
MDGDLLLALELQERYDREGAKEEAGPQRPGGGEMCVVDPAWELLDPNPDIHALFLQYNQLFFWGKLAGVEVRWSPRMTLCAGVCSYERRGGLCSIRLSKPLLSFRPRKDLVETLLHEMIHALLFVTHNNRDRESHGPEFLKHMNRINGLTGAKISVYHSFHDEVNEFRKHWWRCDGPCQDRKPYYGYVKRAMNRAPSSHDPWWADHQRTCGGTYIKIKEPEPKTRDKTKEAEKPAPRSDKKEETSKDQGKSPAAMKGKSDGVDIHIFGGPGYRLGGSSPSAGSGQRPGIPSLFAGAGQRLGGAEKIQTPIPSSSQSTMTLPKLPMNQILKYTTPLPNNKTESQPAAPRVPKISVANTKAFINIGGVPVKVPYKNVRPTNVVHPVPRGDHFTSMTQKKTSSEPLTSSQSSQKRTSSEPLTSSQKRTSSEPLTSSQSSQKRTSSEPLTSSQSSQKRTSSEPLTSSQKRTSSEPMTSSQSSQKRTSSEPMTSSQSSQKRTSSEPMTSSQSSQKRTSSEPLTSSQSSQKRTSSEPLTSSQSSASASQGSSWGAVQPPKRPRLEPPRSIKDFFQNVPGGGSSIPTITIPDEGGAHSSDQGRKVSCPVCQAKVPEAQINQHLDSCLAS